MSKKTVLVTGATGKQGGAVARKLIERGHKVRALTRNVDAPAARALASLGADIVAGNLTDRASIDRALVGADAVFAMSTFMEAGMEAETTQGLTVADAAKAAGAHLVYTSVGNANCATGIPHFDSKWRVEQHIAKIGATATVLAPVYFMENVVAFTLQQLREGIYATPLKATTKLAQVALADIGAFAAVAIENRDRFVGKRVDLVSDDLTGAQATEILSRAVGKKLTYFQVPMENIRAMSADFATMYEWFERVGYKIDPAALSRDYPEVGWHTYESWAKSQDWAAILRQ